jgi:hypothetical protein
LGKAKAKPSGSLSGVCQHVIPNGFLRNLPEVSKTEHTVHASEGEANKEDGVEGLVCGRSAPKVVASTKGSDSGSALPVRLRGMLGSYSLNQFLLAFDPPYRSPQRVSGRLKRRYYADDQ